VGLFVQAEMQRFTEKVVATMKGAGLYASQGGPIILSQIENEYGNIDTSYGAAAKPYIRWAAGMAVALDTGVPWVMCQQNDAPDPIVTISTFEFSLQISSDDSVIITRWHRQPELNCETHNNADQHVQRVLLRPVHAQLQQQAQAVDGELERLVPLLRRRSAVPPHRGPRLRRRAILPARRHNAELLHGMVQ
jgi:hypothetical protein